MAAPEQWSYLWKKCRNGDRADENGCFCVSSSCQFRHSRKHCDWIARNKSHIQDTFCYCEDATCVDRPHPHRRHCRDGGLCENLHCKFKHPPKHQAKLHNAAEVRQHMIERLARERQLLNTLDETYAKLHSVMYLTQECFGPDAIRASSDHIERLEMQHNNYISSIMEMKNHIEQFLHDYSDDRDGLYQAKRMVSRYQETLDEAERKLPEFQEAYSKIMEVIEKKKRLLKSREDTVASELQRRAANHQRLCDLFVEAARQKQERCRAFEEEQLVIRQKLNELESTWRRIMSELRAHAADISAQLTDAQTMDDEKEMLMEEQPKLSAKKVKCEQRFAELEQDFAQIKQSEAEVSSLVDHLKSTFAAKFFSDLKINHELTENQLSMVQRELFFLLRDKSDAEMRYLSIVKESFGTEKSMEQESALLATTTSQLVAVSARLELLSRGTDCIACGGDYYSVHECSKKCTICKECAFNSLRHRIPNILSQGDVVLACEFCNDPYDLTSLFSSMTMKYERKFEELVDRAFRSRLEGLAEKLYKPRYVVQHIEDALNKKCPHCGIIYHDFSACCAITCAASAEMRGVQAVCGKSFCALCDYRGQSAEDVHRHLRDECPNRLSLEDNPADGPYFYREEYVQKKQDELAIRRIIGYLANHHNPGEVLVECRKFIPIGMYARIKRELDDTLVNIPAFEMGQRFDCRDITGKWYPAVFDDMGEAHIKVHFIGWASQTDECIRLSEIESRIDITNSHTRGIVTYVKQICEFCNTTLSKGQMNCANCLFPRNEYP